MSNDRSDDTTIRSTPGAWGRTRSGRPALAIAIPIGLLLAAGAGGLAVLAQVAGPRPWLGALVFTVVSAAPAMALVLGLVVDRSTLRTAVRRPEDSIEADWFRRAASGALTDVVLLVGIAAVVTSFWTLTLPTNLVLAAVLLVAMLASGARFALLRAGRLR